MSDDRTRDPRAPRRAPAARSTPAAGCPGPGGGISGPADDGGLLLAPTGVHKERIQPDEFFTVDPADGSVLAPPPTRPSRPSECNAIFCLAARERGARSVVHSHALSAVLAGDLAPSRRPRRDPRPRDAQGHPRPRPIATSTCSRSSATRPARASSSSSSTRVLADPRFASQLRGRRRRPRRVHLGRRRLGGQAPHRGLSLPVRSRGRTSRPSQGGTAMSRHETDAEPRTCSHLTKDRCRRRRSGRRGRQAHRGRRLQAHLPRSRHAVERVRLPGSPRAVPHPRPHDPRRDRLRARRHRPGDRRWRDPAGQARRRLGHPGQHARTAAPSRTLPQVLFISSPIDDPDDQDRVWLDD